MSVEVDMTPQSDSFVVFIFPLRIRINLKETKMSYHNRMSGGFIEVH